MTSISAVIVKHELPCLSCARSAGDLCHLARSGDSCRGTRDCLRAERRPRLVVARPEHVATVLLFRCPTCGGRIVLGDEPVDRAIIRIPLPAEEARPKRGRPPQSKLIATAEPRPKTPAPCRVCRLVPSRDASHRLCWTCEAARKRERAKEQSA